MEGYVQKHHPNELDLDDLRLPSSTFYFYPQQAQRASFVEPRGPFQFFGDAATVDEMEFIVRAWHSGAFISRFLSSPWDAAPSIVSVAQWFSETTPSVDLASLFLCISLAFLLLFSLHRLYFRRLQSRLRKTLIPMADGSLSPHLNICSSQTPDQIFILSGQSNMAGRGGVESKHYKDGSVLKEWDHVVPPECDAEKGSIWCLNGKLDWVEACEPMHHDIDLGKVCGLGPGLVFAASVLRQWKGLKESPPSIGLVPCAIGGTQIKEWEKGSKLYEQMIHRAKYAIANSGTIKALLWYQGESDTCSSINVKEFPQRLKSLFMNIRRDLQNDELPIIQVGITAKHHPHPEWLEEVRCAQMAVNLPGVYYVDANGLALLEDNIHLTMHSQVQLGKWLADCYLNLLQDC
ncbi:hypothetical protein GOP47_0012395 [Adiantum capillus-veneris]|uniref:Sialate O-acetylesterase domain-containing protein n=1 Tax=Adiantum capillus-veneris TaxID=13818 RepID=A0A9D4UQK9_ADICA|nr:hypothetical protein GOP47_0012395 [Adiantum capillus-veneris]